MLVSECRRTRTTIRTSTAFATENPIAVSAVLPARAFTATLATKQAARVQRQSEPDRSSRMAASRPLDGQMAATGPSSRFRAMPSQAAAANSAATPKAKPMSFARRCMADT
jgi:hypothetical protein